MRNLKTIEGKVRAVLQKDEEARNDDIKANKVISFLGGDVE